MFFYPPSRWSNDDIESQISQQSSTQSFHVPAHTRRRTDDVENQQSHHHSSVQNPFAPSLYAFGDLGDQYSNAQSFERHSQHDLSYISTGRHRRTSDPEIQHPTPQLFERGENDLQNQYSSTRSFEIEHHSEHNLTQPPTQRHRRTSNPETQYPNIQTLNLFPTFQNDYTVDDIESQCPRVSNPRSLSFPLQKPLPDIEPSSFKTDYAYAHSDTSLISKMLDFFTTKLPNIHPLSLTRSSSSLSFSSSPFDVNNVSENANKNMWQCLPNSSWEDLEGGKVCFFPLSLSRYL
ncbi:hypothetical protein OCU04_010535 [Sclerotinia nivalis]|uniref:Uncharacterized protein n=1 Tax=Sclerotinia nivalis TaxID=352851 RepID=A0A9X0ACF4_9HELO|nr:hypothetical protein OCU04_010535 [Sclerotinia nivalis]